MEKYEEVYERVEDFILECEYAEYFGEDTTILSEQLELLDEKWRRFGINFAREKGKKLLQSTGNVLKGLGKPNKKQLELIKQAKELNKGQKLTKWQQGRFNKAIKKGKSPELALKFSQIKKEPGLLGKASNFVKGIFNKKWKKDAAIVGGTVLGLDALSKSDKAKNEKDKIIDKTTETDSGKYKVGDVIKNAIVKGYSSFGCFFDVNSELDVLVHLQEISYSRVSHPEEIFNIGEKHDLLVISVDKEKQQVGCSIKQLSHYF